MDGPPFVLKTRACGGTERAPLRSGPRPGAVLSHSLSDHHERRRGCPAPRCLSAPGPWAVIIAAPLRLWAPRHLIAPRCAAKLEALKTRVGDTERIVQKKLMPQLEEQLAKLDGASETRAPVDQNISVSTSRASR